MTLCNSATAKSGECRFRICFLLKRQVWCSWYWVATLKKLWSTKFHYCKILVYFSRKTYFFNKDTACQLISSTSCGNGWYLSMLFGVYVGIIFFNLGPTLRQFPWSLRLGCGVSLFMALGEKSIWSLRTKSSSRWRFSPHIWGGFSTPTFLGKMNGILPGWFPHKVRSSLLLKQTISDLSDGETSARAAQYGNHSAKNDLTIFQVDEVVFVDPDISLFI